MERVREDVWISVYHRKIKMWTRGVKNIPSINIWKSFMDGPES